MFGCLLQAELDRYSPTNVYALPSVKLDKKCAQQIKIHRYWEQNLVPCAKLNE